MAAGLGKDGGYFAGMAGALQSKRDRLSAGLAQLGMAVLPSQGSYLVVGDITPLGFDGDDIALCATSPGWPA